MTWWQGGRQLALHAEGRHDDLLLITTTPVSITEKTVRQTRRYIWNSAAVAVGASVAFYFHYSSAAG